MADWRCGFAWRSPWSGEGRCVLPAGHGRRHKFGNAWVRVGSEANVENAHWIEGTTETEE